ncbi:MAG: ABC transporter permease [Chloroflexi bacterium]|nr:ABC transporter permease [Chloroflexota bacterium]
MVQKADAALRSEAAEFSRRRQPLTPLRLLSQVFKVRLAGAGLVVVCVFAAVALLANVIDRYDPVKPDYSAPLARPSGRHFFGTDQLGRDIFSRVVHGARVSLGVATGATLLGVAIGVPLGLLSGFRRGWHDDVIMRVMDGLSATPGILLALALVAALGPGAVNVMVALGIVSVPLLSRLVRAGTLAVRETDYMLAATAVGVKTPRLMAVHIMPNVVAPVLVQGSLVMAFAILAEASLSFLGVGIRPPQPTWGIILADGFQFIDSHFWLSLFPGMAIFFLVLGFNFVGDGLRDVLDPRLGRALGLK